ncbi:MAG: RtcB family protein [Anaerolineae bacterium]|nr:RtcB family protein [Anaerolineae bacterium]
MAKVRSRDAKKLQKSLKSHLLNKAQTHQAWEILNIEGIDAALEYVKETDNPPILQDPIPYQIWGADQIDAQCIAQMQTAARLPIAVKGALMPDAHVGYGLPIGGVLATENAVIPYAVGVDIACRMRITIFEMPQKAFKKQNTLMKNALIDETRFGAGSKFEDGNRSVHAVLDHADWEATSLLKGLKDIAAMQLGSSGGGNHFVEWGTFQLDKGDDTLGIREAGMYLALLSHSGSRAVGYKIANHYSTLARDLIPNIPGEVKHLAWFEMDSAEGQEYWQAMELAGLFASANHEVIHERIARYTGFEVLASVENHHNFAWKEMIDGKEVIVHRKGATPAGDGVLGIIPGSMGDPGYVVRGKGNAAALYSASHGAGRKMSRRKAKDSITKGQQVSYLKQRNVELLGGGLDESPHAYKKIQAVIDAQADLIDVIGEFKPRIVRMAND